MCCMYQRFSLISVCYLEEICLERKAQNSTSEAAILKLGSQAVFM